MIQNVHNTTSPFINILVRIQRKEEQVEVTITL
jgi:hypothetical protein